MHSNRMLRQVVHIGTAVILKMKVTFRIVLEGNKNAVNCNTLSANKK
jgi:hypothetical protein